MNIIAIIPARMGSTRFFGKPLAPIHGLPMLEHVVRRTKMSTHISACYVATCDTIIQNYCVNSNIDVVMTKNTHTRCTSRVAEALEYIEQNSAHVDIVLMVQGDEPMVTASMIDAALTPMLRDESINVVNLMATIESAEEFNNPNTIKVVTDANNNALYFSRAPIPSSMHGSPPKHMYKQVCIIPFRRDALFHFESLKPTQLELAESIDMLRLLEHGQQVHMVHTNTKTQSVDTAEDLAKASQLMHQDPIMQKYLHNKLAKDL